MNANLYPRKARPSIYRLVNSLGVSVETAYAMMLMTATLMDLNPEDETVADTILHDCGVDDG